MSSDSKQPPSLRDWIRQQADGMDTPVDELLIQSQKRDPMWKGTEADHAKARWFAKYWKITIDSRPDDEVHPRGVHYTIYELDYDVEPPTSCSWPVYRNNERCYGYLEDASVLARVLGYVPLDGVIDNKHGQTTITRYGEHHTKPRLDDVFTPTGVSVPEIPRVDDRARLLFDGDSETSPDRVDYAEYAGDRLARQLSRDVEFDPAQQAAYHIELWCEKSLPAAAKDVARRHGVNVVVEGEGDLSYTVAADLVTRINEAGKPGLVLYLSDFDPKGDNMASAMTGKLAWLKQRGDLNQRVLVDQLAVTVDQIRELDLPRKPISGSDPNATGTGGRAYDTLVDEWERRKGSGAVELQALWKDHGIFVDILEDGLSTYVDDRLRSKNQKAIVDWKDDVRESVREAVDESELGGQLSDVEGWVDDFNDDLEDAQEVIEQLRTMLDDGAFAEWTKSVRETLDELDVPEAEPPEAVAELPNDPLYDSDRSYGENLASVRAHKEGAS